MPFQRMCNSNVEAFFSPRRGDVIWKIKIITILIITIIIIITMMIIIIIITKAIITLTIIMKFRVFRNSRPEGYSKKHTAKILQNLQRNTSAELSF